MLTKMKFDNKFSFSIHWLSLITILFFSVFPLLFNLPFRIHLDLPWEGAYRMYLGQMPYRDFGMPLGYGFFIVPLFCFFVFGPTLKSLIIAQSIITFIGALAFKGILEKLELEKEKIFLSVLVFCLSYTFLFFWPWYNNTAITYELIGIYYLLAALKNLNFKTRLIQLFVSAGFIALTFLTKQDYGGLAILFVLILCAFHTIHTKKWELLFYYLGFLVLAFVLLILPVIGKDFLYWFNYGQAPHESRLKSFTIIDEIMANSEWEKFYLMVIILVILHKWKKIKKSIRQLVAKEPKYNTRLVLFILLALGMVLQALITKSTSGNSLANTTYYHGFVFALVLGTISFKFDLSNKYFLTFIVIGCFIWWSGMYWKYAGRMFKPSTKDTTTAAVDTSMETLAMNYVGHGFKSMKGTNLPQGTVDGILRLQKMPVFTDTLKRPMVLNMTELTMLAKELNYEPIKKLPLWYHVGVGIFDQQLDSLAANTKAKKYDVVLFEEIPSLNNFFPERIRDSLRVHYLLHDAFLAPRKEGDSIIEVYVRK